MPPVTRETLAAWGRQAPLYGRPVIEQLRHPVFHVASEYYHDRPVQWGVMGQVLETLLFRLAVQNETHCPGLRHDELIPVAREAFEQGRRLKCRRPDLLAAIREEAGAEEWRSACNLVFRVAAMAGGIHPAALAGAILLWEFQNYGRGHGLYGGQLERFVRYFGFSIRDWPFRPLPGDSCDGVQVE